MEASLTRFNGQELAYVGDAVYELFIRTKLIEKIRSGVNDMNREAFSIVNAKAQAKAILELRPLLTEEEWGYVTYGRNSKGKPTKAASVSEYRYATGLECLLGSLYLSHKEERLEEILGLLYERTIVHEQDC